MPTRISDNLKMRNRVSSKKHDSTNITFKLQKKNIFKSDPLNELKQLPHLLNTLVVTLSLISTKVQYFIDNEQVLTGSAIQQICN